LWLEVNGERREVTDGLSLGELITSLNLPPERIAIELNQNVVRRVDWATTKLSHDDRVEIVHFVGGGVTGLPIADLMIRSLPANRQSEICNRKSAI
jgi:thiamine biosynthesis protein ThiS